jgi:predicted phage-related endonuclease
LPDSAAGLITQYDVAREQAEKYTEQKREAENRLKEMLGTHEVGIIGEHSVRWKTISKEGFDSKLLKSEQPDTYKGTLAKQHNAALL